MMVMFAGGLAAVPCLVRALADRDRIIAQQEEELRLLRRWENLDLRDHLSSQGSRINRLATEIAQLKQNEGLDSEAARRIVALENRLKELKAEVIQIHIEIDIKPRQNALMERLLELEKLPRKAEPQCNPPPVNVKGDVIEVDASSGWMTVNLGSEDGLAKEHTLEVYRLKPRPTYVGMLLIYEARPHDAVGKLTGPGSRGRAQIGDIVASELPSQEKP
jgi:hypothetical protein